MADGPSSKIWSMHEGKKNTWWWWFWLFFLEPERKGRKPEQIMVLWSRKRERSVICNGIDLNMLDQPVIRNGQLEFNGAVASWYYDGKEMHEDFILEPTKLVLNERSRSLQGKNALFLQKGNKFFVELRGGGTEMHLIAEEEKKIKPIYAEHHLLRTLDYRILKYNRLKLRGFIRKGGSKRKIKGSAYFQKVAVGGPVIPWQWSMVHFGNGSYLSYNMGRLGHSFFAEHHSPLDLRLNGKMEFYDADANRTYKFKGLKLKRSKGRLPTWRVRAKSSLARIDIELETASRSLWKLEKGRLNTLYYHEFCVLAKHFQLKKANGEISLEQLGAGVGNCEDAKGMFI